MVLSIFIHAVKVLKPGEGGDGNSLHTKLYFYFKLKINILEYRIHFPQNLSDRFFGTN